MNVTCETCPPHTRPEQHAGECCPRCNRLDDRCAEGQTRYEERWRELEGELRGCKADEDCVYASFSDACRARCPLPVNKLQLGQLVPGLREDAALHCGGCEAPSFQCPPLDTKSVTCVGGRCEFSPRAAPP